MGFWSFLFLALLSTSFAQEIPKYFKVGGQLELDPEFKGPALTNIVWKLNGDLVAEWIQALDILDHYRFKGRTTLDTKTGRLTMKNLTDADQGTFTVELNHKVQLQRYIAKAILEVPEPDVLVQPLVCHIDTQTECTLKCDGDTTGAEPVTYSWRKGDGEWRTGDQEITITKTETKNIEEYSCRMNNPVSSKASKYHKNPFFEEKIPPEPESPNADEDVGVGLGIVIVLAVVWMTLGVMYQGKVKQLLSSYPSADISVNGDKPPSSGGASAQQPEAVPLNELSKSKHSA